MSVSRSELLEHGERSGGRRRRFGMLGRRGRKPGGGDEAWYFVVATVLSILVSGLLVSGCRSAAREARDAAASHDRCRRLAMRIRDRMASQPLLASPAPGDFEYGAAIRRAAESAGIPRGSFPDPSLGTRRSIGKTRYVEQEVDAGVGPVTMPQLVTFLHKLATAEPPFQVREIELEPARRPEGGAEGEWWLPQLTLTYTTVSESAGR